MIRFFQICLVAGCAGGWAQVQLGAGSYLTSGGAVPGGTPYVTDDLGQPPKTAQWYSTLITTAFSGELYAHPASFKATGKGLEMDYPGAAVLAGNGFANQHRASLTVGIAGMAADAARVCAQSHFSVTARWKDATRTLEATFGHGLPFAYFKVAGGSAAITHAGTVWYNQDGTLGITVAGKAFAVFAPTGSEWTGSGTLTSTLSGKDYLSVAVLPDASPETLAFFKRYAFSFVRKTVVGYAYQEQTAMVISTYGVETEAKEGDERGTIFALLRHQWPEAASPLSKYAYKSARGEMKVAEGPFFQTAMRFNGILPAMPNLGSDPATLARLVASTGGGVGGGDSYYSGKSMGKLAALAQLAEFAGNTQKRNEVIKSLEAGLEAWFKPGGQQLVYNKAWGTLVGYPASFGSDTRLSDHHFHFGYFIMAAAIVAQWDPDWAKPERYGGMVDMLIREVANWRDDDPLFARFRYFDAYEGHGWADGVGFPRGNNQESSSESMNCNAGIILWGINTGNKAIRDLGLFMYVNEARAIAQYWWDVDKAVFPAGYSHSAVGMVWSNGAAYTTWFSGDRSAIHGINFLPITAGHLYLGRDPDHVMRNYQEGNSGGWADLFMEYLAFADGDEAARKYGGGTGSEGGESAAHTYQHIKSLQAIGRLNTQIGADVPTFAVFDKAATRTYTAFNPGGAAATVTFTDGFSIEVPAHTQVSKQGPVKAIPILAGPRKSPRLRRGLWNSAADPYGSAWKAGILSAVALGRRLGAAAEPAGIWFNPQDLSATPLP